MGQHELTQQKIVQQKYTQTTRTHATPDWTRGIHEKEDRTIRTHAAEKDWAYDFPNSYILYFMESFFHKIGICIKFVSSINYFGTCSQVVKQWYPVIFAQFVKKGYYEQEPSGGFTFH